MCHIVVKKIVSLLLVFCFLLPLAPQIQAVEAKQYVSLGDSMTNGYGLPGYDYGGYFCVVPESYPALFAKHFGFELTPLAISGMRSEDLHFILEFPWNDPEAEALANGKAEQDGYSAASHGKYYTVQWWNEVQREKWNAKFTSGDYLTWSECVPARLINAYYDTLAKQGLGYGSGVANMARQYQESIAAADIISLAVGNANFGVYLRDSVLKAMEDGGEAVAWMDYDQMLKACDDQIQGTVWKIRSLVKRILDSSGIETNVAASVLDCVSYTVLSYLVNYRGMLEAIMECNPDAEILILGLINTMEGLRFRYQDTMLDLGACMDVIIGSVNVYLSAIAVQLQENGQYPEAVFYYAEASDVNMWIQEYDSVAAHWDQYPVIRDRFATEICNTVFPMLETEQGQLMVISRTDVESFEMAQKQGHVKFSQYVEKNPERARSVAVYKAVENAIVETYTLDAPDISALINMEAALESALSGVCQMYTQELATAREKNWNQVVQQLAAAATGKTVTLEEALDYVNNDPAMHEKVEGLCDLLATPDALCIALTSDAMICDLLSLLARLEIGEGIGCHPSASGHAVLAKAVIHAYESGHTVQKEAKTNVSRILEKLATVLADYGIVVAGSYEQARAVNYAATEDSYYVALGDSSAAGDSYVPLLASALGVNCKNLADSEMDNVSQTYRVMEDHAADIARADLITIGYSCNAFLADSISRGMDGKPELDWEQFAGAEGAAKIESVISELQTLLKESGLNMTVMDMQAAEVAAAAVENYAYTIASYAYHLPGILEKLHQMSPDATIVVVGMYNPLENVRIKLEEDGTEIAIGQYLDYLVDAAQIHSMACCIVSGNASYVDAPAVQTGYEAANGSEAMDTSGLIRYVLSGGKDMNPSPAGSAYICDSILDAVRTVRRVSGGNRYDTSFAIANEMKEVLGVEKFENIILANSDNFADALAGSYLAAVKEAPIIIGKQKYASLVCEYLNANLAEGATIYILGGTDAMPDSILNDLTVKYNPVRLAGSERYETNLAILKEAGIEGKDLLVATGRDFADSLSASATGLPILLVNGKSGKSLSDEQKAFLATVEGDIYIIGGESAVPASMVEQIETASGKTTTRIAGGSRYETSVKIAEKFLKDAETAVVAYASTFPDGLCGGPLAYTVGAPLLLTKDGKAEAPDYTKGNSITSGYVLGGDGLISDGFAKSVFQTGKIIK